MQPSRPPEPQDDVDRLFARLPSVAPPPDLTARILGALPPAPASRVGAAASPARGRLPWGGITLGAGLVLLLLSLHLGVVLDESGALSVLGQIASDFGGFLGAPGDYLAPLAAELPWLELILALVALLVFWVGSSATVDERRHGHG